MHCAVYNLHVERIPPRYQGTSSSHIDMLESTYARVGRFWLKAPALDLLASRSLISQVPRNRVGSVSVLHTIPYVRHTVCAGVWPRPYINLFRFHIF